MMNKILLGLILSALGLGISLLSPIIHIMLVSYGVESFLAYEALPGLTMHLLLSLVGVPISVSGLLLFRRGVREELEEEALTYSRRPAVEGFESLIQRPRPGGPGEQPRPDVGEKRSKDAGAQLPPRGGVRVKSSGTTIICSKCGAETPVGSRRCRGCGERFMAPDDPLKACPICGCDLGAAMVLGDDVYVCGFCFSELIIEKDLARRIF
jgi:ribosomal protein L40E